jgi:hypothetical protein
MVQVEQDDSAPRNQRYMWYVEACKNHTTVDMPCWEGEDEARRCAEVLIREGWIGPVIKSDKKSGATEHAKQPRVHMETVSKSHPHWREFLPSVDIAERNEQLKGKK